MRVNMPKARNKAANAHSSLVGGSTASLRRKCNKSIDEERNAPAEGWNQYAAAGTALHEVVAEAINKNLPNADVVRDFDGVVIEGVQLDKGLLQRKAVAALDFFDQTVPSDAVFHIEKKMAFKANSTAQRFIPDINGAFGTGDVLFYTADRAGGIDWKFGDNQPVSAVDNDQARFYLCCAILEGLLPVRERYEFHIFQPAAKVTPDEYASEGVYTLEDLIMFAEDLLDAVTARRTHTTGEHCKWCKGRLSCGPYKDMLTTAVQTDIAGLDVHELARWKGMREGVNSFFDMVDAACLRNAQAGLEIPGYELGPSLGDRAWKEEQAAFGALGRMGLAADVRQVKKVISPTQALLQLKAIGTPDKEIEKFERRHVHRPDNGERLKKVAAGQVSKGAINRLGAALKARGI